MFLAPFDVHLPDFGNKDEEIETVVQPDLSVICEPAKIDDCGCLGLPDLAIEITSPATLFRDMKQKLSLYEKHGVKEYWIVHTQEMFAEVFALDERGKYSKPDVYATGDKIEDKLFPGLAVDIGAVFESARVKGAG